jgi:hypothetical protein
MFLSTTLFWNNTVSFVPGYSRRQPRLILWSRQGDARKSKEASTRILIVVSSVLTNKNLVQQMAEKLTIHKGGKVGVWMLYDAERANVLLKIGDEWDVSLSPELVNELKQLRGITSVLWASSDLDWLEKKKHENNSWPDHNEDDIPF